MVMICCDRLNEKGFDDLIYLNTWSLVGEIVWKELGGAVLLEEVCHWGWTLRFQKLTPFPVSCLCLMFIDQDVSSQLLLQCHVCLSAAMLPTMTVMDFNSLNL